MDNPAEDITAVVHKLCQGSPDEQTKAIDTYFTPNASFTHPFCRTGSFEGSRNLIHAIYKWYKLLSPKVELNVNSVGMYLTWDEIQSSGNYHLTYTFAAYDSTNLILYLNITQLFSPWFMPFHHANVTLTTQLQLTRPPNSRKYYIKSQNDLYQNDQLIRFMAPFGLAEFFVHMWQYSSTMMCVLGSFLLAPATRLQQSMMEKREENGPLNVEDEMRNLVSSAMEGVGYKKPEDRRRRPSTSGDTTGDAGSAPSATGEASGSDVQQFGNMQVIT